MLQNNLSTKYYLHFFGMKHFSRCESGQSVLVWERVASDWGSLSPLRSEAPDWPSCQPLATCGSPEVSNRLAWCPSLGTQWFLQRRIRPWYNTTKRVRAKTKITWLGNFRCEVHVERDTGDNLENDMQAPVDVVTDFRYDLGKYSQILPFGLSITRDGNCIVVGSTVTLKVENMVQVTMTICDTI